MNNLAHFVDATVSRVDYGSPVGGTVVCGQAQALHKEINSTNCYKLKSKPNT